MFPTAVAVLGGLAIIAGSGGVLRHAFADYRRVNVPKLRAVEEINRRRPRHRADGWSTAQANAIEARWVERQLAAAADAFHSWADELMAAPAHTLPPPAIGPGHDHYVALSYLPRVPNAPYDADVWSIWGTQMDDDEWASAAAGAELVHIGGRSNA